MLHEDVERLLWSESQLQQRVQEMGKQIAADYAGKRPLILGVRARGGAGARQPACSSIGAAPMQLQRHDMCLPLLWHCIQTTSVLPPCRS